MDEKIFRKEALDKRFSSNQFEKLLIVARPKKWLGLICLILLFASFILWFFLMRVFG